MLRVLRNSIKFPINSQYKFLTIIKYVRAVFIIFQISFQFVKLKIIIIKYYNSKNQKSQINKIFLRIYEYFVVIYRNIQSLLKIFILSRIIPSH